MPQYFLFHKPYRVLSQFSAEGDKSTLADYFPGISKNIYPVGRLDYDSEGLLILTDDKSLTHHLLDPSFNHERTYWVQVDGIISQQAIEQLCEGVTINIDSRSYRTKKAMVKVLTDVPDVPERNPPVRYRKNIPTSWVSVTLTEGKNRQVRRMLAATGFPVLRLIRYAIGALTLDGLSPGAHRPLKNGEKELLLSKK